jgi:hypothetical protein
VEQVEMLLMSTWKGSPDYNHPSPEQTAEERARGGDQEARVCELKRYDDPKGEVVGDYQKGAHLQSEVKVPDAKQGLSPGDDPAAGGGFHNQGGLVLSAEREEDVVLPYAPASDPMGNNWGGTKLQMNLQAELKRERAARPVLDLNLPPPLSEEEEQDFLRDSARVEQQALFPAGNLVFGGRLEVAADNEPGSLPVPQLTNLKARSSGGHSGAYHTQGVPLGITVSHPCSTSAMELPAQGAETVLLRCGNQAEGTAYAQPDFPRFIDLRYSMDGKSGGDSAGVPRDSEPLGMLKRGVVEPPREMEGSGWPLTGERSLFENAAKRTRFD